MYVCVCVPAPGGRLSDAGSEASVMEPDRPARAPSPAAKLSRSGRRSYKGTLTRTEPDRPGQTRTDLDTFVSGSYVMVASDGSVPAVSRLCPGSVPPLSQLCPGSVLSLPRLCPGSVPAVSCVPAGRVLRVSRRSGRE